MNNGFEILLRFRSACVWFKIFLGRGFASLVLLGSVNLSDYFCVYLHHLRMNFHTFKSNTFVPLYDNHIILLHDEIKRKYLRAYWSIFPSGMLTCPLTLYHSYQSLGSYLICALFYKNIFRLQPDKNTSNVSHNTSLIKWAPKICLCRIVIVTQFILWKTDKGICKPPLKSGCVGLKLALSVEVLRETTFVIPWYDN